MSQTIRPIWKALGAVCLSAMLLLLCARLMPYASAQQPTNPTGVVPADGQVAVPAQGDDPPSEKIRAQALAALTQQLKRNGTARVIVRLSGAFKSDALLERQPNGATLAAAQRQDIAHKQEALLRALPAINAASVKRYEFIPHVAFEIDANGWQALLASPLVSAIEEDAEARPTLTESTGLIGARTAWQAGLAGTGQVVAVLDTGVDKNHEFLRGKVVSEACYSTTNADYNSVCPGGVAASTAVNSALPPRNNGGWDHGTHVAGIVAGQSPSAPDTFAGVARDARLIAIQVFSEKKADGTNLAFNSNTISGLERVYALRNEYKIAAANLSLGGGKFTSNCDDEAPAYKAIIDTLRTAGIATIAASGNEKYTDAVNRPACISSAIAVGATTDGTDRNNNPNGVVVDTVADFSNSSPLVKLLAPGAYIRSSYPNNRYATIQGTSMAAPHVAGAYAVMRQKFPNASVEEITDTLVRTGKPITDTRNNVTKPRIQLDAALGLNTTTTTEELRHDDGTIETGALLDGGLVVNRFKPPRYPSKLTAIKFYFSKARNQPDPQGQRVRFFVFQGGSFDNIVPVGVPLLFDQTYALPDISDPGFYSITFNSPLTITEGDWYIGYQAPNPASGFAFWYDSNGPQAQRSYVSTNNGLAYAPLLTTNGQPLNAMIRGVIENTVPGPQILPLAAGTAVTGTVAAAAANSCVLLNVQYALNVPATATQLTLALTGTQDVDLYVRRGSPIAVQNQQAVADYRSTTIGANSETLTITRNSSPPLATGDHYIAITNCSTSPANFTLLGTLTNSQQCTYALAPSSQIVASAASNNTVNVTAAAGCNWTAASNVEWLTITGGAAGTGNGAVTYNVAANTATAVRAGTLTIAGQTFSVTQSGATVSSGNHLLNIGGVTGNAGGAVTVPVEIVALGDESAVSFSLNFDPAVLSLPIVVLGSGFPSGGGLSVQSQSTQGRLGVTASLPAGQRFSPGLRQVVTVRFSIASSASVAATPLTFGDVPVARKVSDASSNSLTATYTNGGITIIRAAANVSAASYVATALAPDSIVAAFGAALAPRVELAATDPLPTHLAGTRILIRDSAGAEHEARLFFVSPAQINYLLPAETALGGAQVTITRDDGGSAVGNIEVAATAPGVFTANANGQGIATAVLLRVAADGTQSYEPVAQWDGARFRAQPISFGDATDRLFLLLFGTGVRQNSSLANVRLTIGGTDCAVLYAGASGGFAGLDQINAELPRSLAARGELDVNLFVEGRAANTVKLAFR